MVEARSLGGRVGHNVVVVGVAPEMTENGSIRSTTNFCRFLLMISLEAFCSRFNDGVVSAYVSQAVLLLTFTRTNSTITFPSQASHQQALLSTRLDLCVSVVLFLPRPNKERDGTRPNEERDTKQPSCSFSIAGQSGAFTSSRVSAIHH